MSSGHPKWVREAATRSSNWQKTRKIMQKLNVKGRSKLYMLIDHSWVKIDPICLNECDEKTQHRRKTARFKRNFNLSAKEEKDDDRVLSYIRSLPWDTYRNKATDSYVPDVLDMGKIGNLRGLRNMRGLKRNFHDYFRPV